MFYDELIFQTSRPGLTTVRWKKVTVVQGIPDTVQDITNWSIEDVIEVGPGQYYIRVPVEDSDPKPTILVCDTGDGETAYTRAVKLLEFRPESLVEVNSGGGILSGRVGSSSLSPEKYLEIVQGEEKTITFIIEAVGRFEIAVAEEITVKIQDPRGNKVRIENEAVERVCQELDIQVIRATLTPDQTLQLEEGVARIEISFDHQKSVLQHHLKVIEDIELEAS